MAKAKDSSATTPPGVPADGAPVVGGEAGAAVPVFGTPVPAGPGDLPRVVPELARAGRGETRYKIALRGGDHPTRYVLALDAKSAEACYLAAEGLAAVPPDARLAVTTLPD